MYTTAGMLLLAVAGMLGARSATATTDSYGAFPSAAPTASPNSFEYLDPSASDSYVYWNLTIAVSAYSECEFHTFQVCKVGSVFGTEEGCTAEALSLFPGESLDYSYGWVPVTADDMETKVYFTSHTDGSLKDVDYTVLDIVLGSDETSSDTVTVQSTYASSDGDFYSSLQTAYSVDEAGRVTGMVEVFVDTVDGASCAGGAFPTATPTASPLEL